MTGKYSFGDGSDSLRFIPIQDTLGAGEIELCANELAKLGFPHDFLAAPQVRDLIHGEIRTSTAAPAGLSATSDLAYPQSFWHAPAPNSWRSGRAV